VLTPYVKTLSCILTVPFIQFFRYLLRNSGGNDLNNGADR